MNDSKHIFYGDPPQPQVRFMSFDHDTSFDRETELYLNAKISCEIAIAAPDQPVLMFVTISPESQSGTRTCKVEFGVPDPTHAHD